MESTLYSPSFLAFSGIRSLRHPNRPWLHQCHEPRHGPAARAQISPWPWVTITLLLLLMASTSSGMPLSTGPETFWLFLYLPYYTIHLFAIIVPIYPLPGAKCGPPVPSLSTQSIMVLGMTLLPKIIIVLDCSMPNMRDRLVGELCLAPGLVTWSGAVFVFQQSARVSPILLTQLIFIKGFRN